MCEHVIKKCSNTNGARPPCVVQCVCWVLRVHLTVRHVGEGVGKARKLARGISKDARGQSAVQDLNELQQKDTGVQ